jgi:glycosyltransferase involved in cell wall biosynthesis
MIFPKITVITPTLNTGESIETALLSVANQTYTNVEHIIVDGTSKDKTLPTIRRYQKIHHNIRLLTEKDIGIYDALNKGLDLCTGDWIYFMGADDAFYNDHILTDLFEQGLFQEEQIVYGNVIIKGDAPWAKDNTIYDGPFTLEKLFKWNICHQSIFYPKSVIRQVGYYNTKYKVTSDWDYNIRCWAKYKYAYTDTIIAFFKTGGKSSDGGDYALHLDFPDNIIKYFQLDILDPNLYLATSSFFYPMARYRENEYLNSIRKLKELSEQLKQDVANQKTEHSELVIALAKQHETSNATVRSEFEETFNKLKTEQENSLASIRSEYDAVVTVLKKEHEQIVNGLKKEHEQIVNGLKKEHEQVVNGLKEEHEQVVNGLKEEHVLLAANLRTEHDQNFNYIKSEHENLIADLNVRHAESFNSSKQNYESIIKLLQNEQQSFWDLFRQKESEFMQVIESNNNYIEHLKNTIAKHDLQFRETIENYNSEIVILKEEITARKREIASIYESYTWKIGKALLSPAIFVAKKVNKTRNSNRSIH